MMSSSSFIMVYMAPCFKELLPLVYKNCRLKQRLLSKMNSFDYNSMKLGHIIKYHNVFNFQNGKYHIMLSGVNDNSLFIIMMKNWVSHILFLRKRGAYHIPGSAAKGVYSGPHIHTMSYISSYPLHPRGECGSRPPPLPPGKSQIAKGFSTCDFPGGV